MITELHIALLPRSVCSQRGANERVNKSVQAGDPQSGLVVTSSSTMAAGMHSNEALGRKQWTTSKIVPQQCISHRVESPSNMHA